MHIFLLDAYNSYQVEVRDSGRPSLSSTALVVISVEDYNDNPPLFSPENAQEVTGKKFQLVLSVYRSRIYTWSSIGSFFFLLCIFQLVIIFQRSVYIYACVMYM